MAQMAHPVPSLVAVVLSALLLGMGADGAGHLGPDTAAPGTGGSATAGSAACRTPANAAEWQRLIDAQSGPWTGADGALSVGLADGRTLWLFGDTLTGPVTDAGTLGGGAGMRRNSVVVVDRCRFVVASPYTEFFPNPAPNRWWWPASATALPAGPDGAQRILVGLAENRRITTTATGGNGGWDFAGTGAALALVTVPPGGTPVAGTPVRLTMPGVGTEGGVLWGAASEISSGLVYLFGTRSTGVPLVFGKQVLVARAPVASVLSPSSWTFWDGRGWSSSPADAAVVRAAEDGTATSFSAHRDEHGWLLVTKQDDGFGDTVVALTAPLPYGPFRRTVLFSSPSTGSVLTYLALAHPELPAPAGWILVTVNRNSPELAVVSVRPDLYRPQFTLARLPGH